MRYSEAVVVIPTRDRVDLLRNAVRSILSQSDSVRVLVSDNSTSAENRCKVSQYCGEPGNERLIYIAPPEPLPMSQHWDWAMQRALSTYNATHFTFLTDRMVFKPDALRSLIAIITAYPDRLLCYMHDKVYDFARPYKVLQNEWSGKLYEVPSARLLKLTAESVMYDACVPRMLNCLVPRTILEKIQSRFGSVFSSVAPDWVFAYRSLDTVDSILFFHKSMLVHYALNRSNGESPHRGIRNSTYDQFVKDLPRPLNVDAPYPEIITVWNAIISEYLYVKKEARSTKFPALNLERYRQALAAGIEYIEVPEIRRDMEQKLMARGWNPAHRFRRQFSLAREMMGPREVLSKLKSLAGSSRFRTFETQEQALEFAVTHVRPIHPTANWEEALHHGVEVSPMSTQASTSSGTTQT